MKTPCSNQIKNLEKIFILQMGYIRLDEGCRISKALHKTILGLCSTMPQQKRLEIYCVPTSNCIVHLAALQGLLLSKVCFSKQKGFGFGRAGAGHFFAACEARAARAARERAGARRDARGPGPRPRRRRAAAAAGGRRAPVRDVSSADCFSR